MTAQVFWHFPNTINTQTDSRAPRVSPHVAHMRNRRWRLLFLTLVAPIVFNFKQKKQQKARLEGRNGIRTRREGSWETRPSNKHKETTFHSAPNKLWFASEDKRRREKLQREMMVQINMLKLKERSKLYPKLEKWEEIGTGQMDRIKEITDKKMKEMRNAAVVFTEHLNKSLALLFIQNYLCPHFCLDCLERSPYLHKNKIVLN